MDDNKRKPIGQILIEKGFITHQQLNYALRYQSTLFYDDYKPIGEILIELNYVTKEQVNECLGSQQEINPNSLEFVLKEFGFLNNAQLAMVLSRKYSLEGKHSIPTAELLVKNGFITKEELEIIMREHNISEDDINF